MFSLLCSLLSCYKGMCVIKRLVFLGCVLLCVWYLLRLAYSVFFSIIYLFARILLFRIKNVKFLNDCPCNICI